MPAHPPYNVLFLCTGNAARSILAEAMLRHLGQDRFRAFSAGSHPTGELNPFALEFLRSNRIPTDALSSKSWNEFAAPGAPLLDFVFTVCDAAAGEVCPAWPGQPMTAHWGVADPAAVQGTDEQRRKAMSDAAHVLLTRIRLLTSLPIEKLERLSLARAIAEIGTAR